MRTHKKKHKRDVCNKVSRPISSMVTIKLNDSLYSETRPNEL